MAHANYSVALRILARLISYPDAALRADLPELRAALAGDAAFLPARRRELDALAARLGAGDAIEHEAEYVRTFDQGRATSLHLFEHVHGDSRERGPAMIDLCQTYESAGLLLAPDELPDYLPVVLEFSSTLAPAAARDFLGEIAHLVNALFNALQQRHSPYASVMGALLELCGERAHEVSIAPDESPDASWAEPPAFDGCSTGGQRRPDAVMPIHFAGTDKSAPVARGVAR